MRVAGRAYGKTRLQRLWQNDRARGGGAGSLIMTRPGWRNGIRGRLKPVCPKGHRGSTPLSGTTFALVRPLFMIASGPVC
jgi:hypothetical protein